MRPKGVVPPNRSFPLSSVLSSQHGPGTPCKWDREGYGRDDVSTRRRTPRSLGHQCSTCTSGAGRCLLLLHTSELCPSRPYPSAHKDRGVCFVSETFVGLRKQDFILPPEEGLPRRRDERGESDRPCLLLLYLTRPRPAERGRECCGARSRGSASGKTTGREEF